MKILMVATVQSHIAQFHLGNISMLKNAGYTVHVAARNNLAEKNGLQIEGADMVFDVDFDRSPFSTRNITAYRTLCKIINHEKYDIIHCNTPVGGIVTRLAARRWRKKGTIVIYTAHGFHFYAGAPKKNWVLYYTVERFLARYTDKLITINDEDFNRVYKKFPCEVYHTHGVGIKKQKYDMVTEEQVLNCRKVNGYVNRFIILCTGELNTNKNQMTVIQAMPKVVEMVPQALLLLAGNGSEEEHLEKEIKELGLTHNVKLIGYRTDIPVFVRMSDVVVSASYREGLPLNVVEAMYCKKPVVASINRGHNELIHDGENGYLVAPDRSEEFAEKLSLLAASEQLRIEMGRKGFRVSLEYTDEAVNGEMAKIYGLIEDED